MEDRINIFIENYFTNEDGDIQLYRTIKKDGEKEDCSIEDSITQLFKDKGFWKNEYTVKLEHPYDSPGLDVFCLFIAWIENSKLYTIIKTAYRC